MFQGSDGGSVVFASTPTQATVPSPAAPRKADFPQTGLPLSNGQLGLGGNSASQVPNAPNAATLPPPSLPPPYTTPMQVCRINVFITYNVYLYKNLVIFLNWINQRSSIEQDVII